MGKTISCSVYEELGYELLASSEDPYYIARFFKMPDIIKKPLRFQNGETLEVGEHIAYIGGDKLSAGYDMLYPFAPIVFRYDGITMDLEGKELVLWMPIIEDDGKDAIDFSADKDAVFVRYAHSRYSYDNKDMLLFTNRAGAGRVIETTNVYRCHSEIIELSKRQKEKIKCEN